jgi:hypothetical protein
MSKRMRRERGAGGQPVEVAPHTPEPGSEDPDQAGEAPETPPDEPAPTPIEDPPAEPDTSPYVVR